MCGICVVIGEGDNSSLLNKMIYQLEHRGPDGNGRYENNHLSMGHTRLRIIDDNKRSDQPMISKCGRYIIIFNGEIYNYKYLKDTFNLNNLRTNSDTEILLELFIKYGDKCNKYLKGMFAYAIWDNHSKKLFCSVDHFGIKPLYYAFINEKFIICSEPKIIASLQENKKPNYKTIYDYLGLGLCDHSENTFYKEIYRLQGGMQFWIDTYGNLVKEIYWELNDYISPNQLSYEDAKHILYEKLSTTVKLGTVSDMPVGLCMSGGLDSSSMLEILSGFDGFNKGKNGITGFTSDFLEEEYSEYKYTKFISDHFSLKLKRSLFSIEDFEDYFFISNEQQGEPQTGLPILSYSKCINEARKQGFKVLLDGSGIDEMCGGYLKYNTFTNLLNIPGSIYSVNNSYLRKGQDNTSGIDYESLNHKKFQKYTKIPHKLLNNFDSILKFKMYLDISYFKLPRALRFRDRLSMAYGCELRPPFLDHELVTFFFSLPDNFLINEGVNKKIMRDLMSKKIPSQTALAEKRQVQSPQREWFRNDLKEWLILRFKKSILWDFDILNKEKSYIRFNKFIEGKGDNSMFIWQWLDLDLWLKNNF